MVNFYLGIDTTGAQRRLPHAARQPGVAQIERMLLDNQAMVRRCVLRERGDDLAGELRVAFVLGMKLNL